MSSKKTKDALSDFEWQIMNQVWGLNSASAREILTALPQQHQRAYTTIQTYMERLVEKKFLSKTKVGLVNFYVPLIAREKAVSKETKRFVDQVFGGSMSQLAAYLAGHNKVSPEDLDEIKEMLEEKKDDWANY